MLIRVGTLLGALLLAAPAQAQISEPPTRGTATMPDTSSTPGGARVPFTREEYERALLFAMPHDEASLFVRLVFDNPENLDINIQDGDLLLVAALSDDAGARIVKYRPRLADQVRHIRADPESFIAEVRRAANGS